MARNQPKCFLFSIAFAIMAFTPSCSDGENNKPSALVGQWEYASGDYYEERGIKPDNVELFKDGTGVIDKMTISWKVENKRLVILSTFKGFSCNYEVSGYGLALTYDDGRSAIFVRKGKLEEFKAELVTEFAKQIAACANKGYKTVKIGRQTWMAENFNCNIGNSICYNNNEANCKKYGRLYDWKTAMSVCPKGWHLPSKSEWEELDKAVGGEEVAGKKLKAKSGWNSNGNGTDEFGFSALPGGGGKSSGSFDYVGDIGYWWSANEGNRDYAYSRSMEYDGEYADWSSYEKSYLHSVRCLKD